MANFTCPGSFAQAWHSCLSGSRFVGCCQSQTVDPCDLGCNPGNLAPASFNSDLDGKIPTLECNTPEAQFYACPDTSPSFLGCCKSDACAQSTGCPTEDLFPAYLSSNPDAISVFNPTGTPSPSAAAPSKRPSSHSNSTVVGAAVGGAVGGLVLLGALILFIWWRRRRSVRDHETKRAGTATSDEFYHSNAHTDPTELSASKSVQHPRVPPTPPPRYISPPPQSPSWEGGDSRGEAHVQDPVELEASPPRDHGKAKK